MGANGWIYALEATAYYELQRAQPAQFSLLVLNMARDLSHRFRRLDAAFGAWQ